MSDNTDMTREQALEQLLRKAPPRPVPAGAEEAKARSAVHEEWTRVVRQRTRRSNVAKFALAATVLVAAFLSFNLFRTNGVAPVQVATIDKSFGSIYLIGERSELRETRELELIVAGQAVKTGRGSGLGLALLNGASLRVDEDTRIEFDDASTVRLHSGRVYVDSDPLTAAASSADSVSIVTSQGVVTHLGTQYMTAFRGTELSVSVREGRVTVEGSYHDATVMPGQRVILRGSQRPTVTNIATYGDAWSWTEDMAPGVELDGKSIYDFLQWVGHETGHKIRFETPGAERVAHDFTLEGTVASSPAKALHLWMMTVDLAYRMEDGVIYISEIGAR